MTDKATETTAVAVKTPTVPPIVAEMRRHNENVDKLQKMTTTDRVILAAATGTPLADYDSAQLVETLMQMFNFVALDVGYRKPSDETEWQYAVIRIAEILRRYHSDITTTDIKTAFELLIVGELDAYLPRNSNGEPDRNHYQAFNAEYVTKILTAYKKRQGITVKKARELPAPEPPKALTSGSTVWDRKSVTRKVFDEYKNTKRLVFDLHQDVVVYEYLLEQKQIAPVIVTDNDKAIAFNHYCIQADLGYVNQYEARWVRRAGANAREIQPKAYTVAMHRVIKEYFDAIIKKDTEKKS